MATNLFPRGIVIFFVVLGDEMLKIEVTEEQRNPDRSGSFCYVTWSPDGTYLPMMKRIEFADKTHHIIKQEMVVAAKEDFKRSMRILRDELIKADF